MGFEQLLDHKCNIYHMESKETSLGFGVPTEEFTYPDKPDEKDIDCHFNVNCSENLQQTDNANVYTVNGKVNFALGTDVRVNDKIVDLRNGLEYICEIPKRIRDHHLIAIVHRTGTGKGAL